MDRKVSGGLERNRTANTHVAEDGTLNKIVYPTWTEHKSYTYRPAAGNRNSVYPHGNQSSYTSKSENERRKTNDPKHYERQRLSQDRTHDIASSSSMTRSGVGESRSPYRSSSADDFSFETTLKGDFVLKVYTASVTRVDVDVIVNAANDVMAHGGGVAKVISDAAGYSLDEESTHYVNNNGPVEVGKNIVTTAGRLPYKAVIHAVGPVWHDYRDKVACLDDLFDCVYNVLDTCKKERYKTVAMTAISAGIFGVPKELCADMYVYAAAKFSNSLLPSEYPRELHIIDVDARILKHVEESVTRWKSDSESLNQRITLPKFLEENPHLASFSSYKSEGSRRSEGQRFTPSSEEGSRGRLNGVKSGGRYESSSELASNVARMKDRKFSWGGVAKQYVVDERITVKIYQGDISKVRNMDAIVCGIDKDLEPKGSIANALKNAGGSGYAKSCQRMIGKERYKNVKHSDVFKCEGGSLGTRYVVHAVVKKMLDADAREVEAYQDCIASILQKAKRNDWKKMAIPMIGTGTIQTNTRKLKKCGSALLKALDEFLVINGDKHELNEILLVNSKLEVCDALVDVFDDAADCQAASSTRKSSRYTGLSTGHYLASGASRGRDNEDARQGGGHYKRKSSYTGSSYSSYSKDKISERDRMKDAGSRNEDAYYRFKDVDENGSGQRVKTGMQTDQRARTRRLSNSNVSVGNVMIIDA